MRKRKYTPLSHTDQVQQHSQTNPPEDEIPVPTIHNIVSTSQIKSDTPINLQALALLLPYSFYDRQRFAAITIRLKSPDCTTLLFSSGKLVVTGGRNWFECVLEPGDLLYAPGHMSGTPPHETTMRPPSSPPMRPPSQGEGGGCRLCAPGPM